MAKEVKFLTKRVAILEMEVTRCLGGERSEWRLGGVCDGHGLCRGWP